MLGDTHRILRFALQNPPTVGEGIKFLKGA
jgi:hypothetical protein